MATSDEIGRERQRVSEQLARLDAERAKLANQLNELEIAEHVLRAFVTGSARARSGLPSAPRSCRLTRAARKASRC